MTEVELQKLFEWMRRQPPAIQAVMRRFPPSCHVAADDRFTLSVPEPGDTAQVYCYRDRGEGKFTLLVEDEHGRRGECDLAWVKLAECPDGITPEVVDLVCSTSLNALPSGRA